ncbi:hypothetical protein GH714_027089 [Hevea brasiliensis]|uniref:Uncharacterized protein n=1 Tax=Hevea brasiliensis TaxID=3981 RepID=A0A6A6LWQ6_HEVBR|nr:hypothetical protein GH714_027089 [Hevea brasiliensis]
MGTFPSRSGVVLLLFCVYCFVDLGVSRLRKVGELYLVTLLTVDGDSKLMKTGGLVLIEVGALVILLCSLNCETSFISIGSLAWCQVRWDNAYGWEVRSPPSRRQCCGEEVAESSTFA